VNLTTLLLVLLSASIHATWNLWIKQIEPGSRRTTLIWMLTAISSVAYAPLALWIAWHGSWRLTPAAVPWLVGSGLIHVVYFLFLLGGYRASDLSVVYPVARGTGPVMAAAGAVLLFAEPVTPALVVGASLVALGVLTLAGWIGQAREHHVAAGIRYGLGVGLTIAIYTLWDGWSIKRVAIPPVLFYWGGELTRTVLLAPFAFRDRAGLASLWRAHRVRITLIALMSPLSYILILVAMRGGAVSHIAPAREVSILFGTWLGARVLGEGGRGRRTIAALAIAAGVIALALK
jgi:uncharacterized membrane protein